MKTHVVTVVVLSLSIMSCLTKSGSSYEGQKPGAEGAGPAAPPTPVDYGPTTTPQGGTTQVPANPVNPASDCYKGDAFACQIEALIVQQTNAYRGSRAPLKGDASLSYIARQWSLTQATRGSIGHDGFPNQRERLYSQEFGAAATIDISAENVAMTGQGEESADEVAKAFSVMWWNSPGHRANMVGNYQYIGVGVSKSGSGWYATQIFGN